MRHRLLCAVALLFLASFAEAQQLGPVDWIFLVDTSTSMVGKGDGAKDIFGDVKASIETFVRESRDGDTVAIYTFDRTVELRSSIEIKGRARADLKKIIAGLRAEGDRTYLGGAIHDGLKHAAELGKDLDRARAVVLFTDGREYVAGIPDPIPIEASIPNVGDAHVFFVSMGEHEPRLDAFAAKAPNTIVIRATDSKQIAQVAQDIRIRIWPPAPPVVTISPSTIPFGEIRPGESATREITLTANQPTRVSVTAEPLPGFSMEPIRDLAVPARIALKLTVAKDVNAGARSLVLNVTHAKEPATITVAVLRPSPLIRALQIAVPLLLAALIALYLLHQRRKKNRLDGELEILRPGTPADAAYIGLPKLQASEVALSAILPLDALAGSDARLFVRRRSKSGRKKIWIAAEGGAPLRINDVVTPMCELYDADTIEIGDAKLRFNRVGDERPPEQEETL